jgi:hypothetical protein
MQQEQIMELAITQVLEKNEPALLGKAMDSGHRYATPEKMRSYCMGGPSLGQALRLGGAWQDRQQGEIAERKPVKLPVGTIPGHPFRHLNLPGISLRGQQPAQSLSLLFAKHVTSPQR